jgi:hypothetical protein
MPEIRISRNYFPKGNPWTESMSPWTTGAPVHRGLASVADRRSSSELGLRAPRSTVDCTGRTRSSPGFGIGPHSRWRSDVEAGDCGAESAAAALGESDAQAWREEKRGRERCGEARGWCLPFIGVRGCSGCNCR